jgi:ATP-dependent DNA ligase
VIESCQSWYQVESVQERGYEGFVAKDDSADYSGGRTLSRLKVKQRDYRVKE